MSKDESTLENKNRQEDKSKMPMIFISIFLILIFLILITNISSAVIDCSMCHKTVPGKATIKAADTIEISNKTCLKCHDPDYPPTPIGYNTHLAHVGKYSAKVDYIRRHPSVASLSCDDCHINIGQNCQNCHIKDIPHIPPPLGNSCNGCHGELDKLFRHPTINLKIHDLFNVSSGTACAMCHNPDNMASLKLASGDTVPIQEPHRLCFQCHSNYYNLWDSGQHYSNKTVDITTFEDELPTGRSSQVRASLEDKWRKDNTCTNCHNPHNPSELYQLPIKELGNTSIDVATIILYAVLSIVIVAMFIIFVIKKKKFSLSELRLRLSKLKLSELKLSKLKKLKLPKISLPISISVEKLEETKSGSEQVREVEKVVEKVGETEAVEKGEQGLIEKMEYIKDIESVGIEHVDESVNIEPVHKSDYEEALERLIDETAPKVDKKAEKKNFLYKYRKDIYFILAICMMLGSFYVIFGAFIPITVVVSESMSPHIEKGDLIFYTDISRVDKIIMYNDGKKYQSFDNYGDVILYKQFGQEDVTPYIHRAMYYVSQDDDMWQGGPKAPHDGYITKGDNDLTNPKYDQQGSISLNEPIKREWIVGVARFRIPYIGYIRLLLS